MSQVREGYKQTKVGVIPFDWDVVKIKDISTIKSGATPLRSNELYFNNGQINWVKTRDLNNNYIIDTEEQITEKALVETSVKLLPIDSILIAMYGGFGQIGRTGLLKIMACSNQALSSLELDKDISPRFILEYLNFRRFYWKRYAASSRKDPNITKRDIEVFPIGLPPLKEQEKIAKILTAWDSAISKQVELIKVRQENKKGLMQNLLSGDIRFDGFNGEWEIVKLGKIVNCFDNKRVPISKIERQKIKGDIPYYGSTSIVDYINDYIFDDDLVLVSEDGGYFYDFNNKPIAFYITGKSWINNHAHIIKNKDDSLDLKYLYFSLVHKDITSFLNGGTRAKLNKKELLLMKLLDPEGTRYLHKSKLN